jgi:hypothetical protein
VIFWTYSLYIGNRLPYRESAGNALRPWALMVSQQKIFLKKNCSLVGDDIC